MLIFNLRLIPRPILCMKCGLGKFECADSEPAVNAYHGGREQGQSWKAILCLIQDWVALKTISSFIISNLKCTYWHQEIHLTGNIS